MYGARYAWLIPGWFNKNWWKTKLKNESVACSEDEMNKAVKGYIACDNLKISPDNTVTVSGQVTISLYDILTDKREVRLFPSYLEHEHENEFDLSRNEPIGETHFHMNDSFSSRRIKGQSENSLLRKLPSWLHLCFKTTPRAKPFISKGVIRLKMHL